MYLPRRVEPATSPGSPGRISCHCKGTVCPETSPALPLKVHFRCSMTASYNDSYAVAVVTASRSPNRYPRCSMSSSPAVRFQNRTLRLKTSHPMSATPADYSSGYYCRQNPCILKISKNQPLSLVCFKQTAQRT